MTRTLEDDLRAMLHERAADVTAVSPAVFAHKQTTAEPVQRPGLRHPRLLAVAAGVVAVLAVTGTVLAIRGDSDDATRPVEPGRTASPSITTPAPTPARTDASAALHFSAGIATPPGYTLRQRDITRHSQTMELSKDSDSDKHPGNGGSASTVFVVVYDKGAYEAKSVRTGERTTVAGHRAYFGMVKNIKILSSTVISYDPLPTLAWEYAPNAWALVQGRTAVTQRLAEQRRLAAAVRINLPAVFPVPLRITSIPSRFRAVDGSIDLVGGYGTQITVDAGPPGAESRTQLAITITPGARIPIDVRGATSITVDGRPGVLRESGQDVAASVRIGGHRVSFDLAGPDGGKAVLSRILKSVRWSADPTDAATWVDGRTLLP